jgi:UDP:flavonoid glycosyltransferase YjiC (YdhE family)
MVGAKMKVLVVAMGGAGGDLQPLMAAAIGLLERGHRLAFVGDAAVARVVAAQGLACTEMAPEQDMGQILGGVFKRLANLSLAEQGRVITDEIADWSEDVGNLVSGLLEDDRPDALITSLFGVGAAHHAASKAAIPWAMINSTFYVGPNPPRPLVTDFGPRAIPLIEFFLPLVERATLVLHASDQVFDFDHQGLPENHRYVGPLIWEPESSPAPYLSDPGDPWVLVTLSSQLQDDASVATSAMEGLAVLPLRVLVTTGGSHPPENLGPLPANARAEDYVSHTAALTRSVALVSHAGHGSVMKALWHGVPMVLVPWGRDQPGVADRAERLGVASVIPRGDLSADTIAARVQDVTKSAGYREAAMRHSARLRLTDPVAVACDALELGL